MQQIMYAMQFKGHAQPQNDIGTILRASTSSPSEQIRSIVGKSGLICQLEALDGREARFTSEVVFAADGSFNEEGTISFGSNNVVRFEAIGRGYLGPCADQGLRHGAVSGKIVSGEGQFAGATGIITSNFTVGSAGEVVDNQFGVLFLQ